MGYVVITDKRGGRNGSDPPWKIAENEWAEAINVDYFGTPLARKRGGAIAVALTPGAGNGFTGKVSTLYRHVPGTDQTAAELWATDDEATPVIQRLAGGTTTQSSGAGGTLTLKDVPTGNGWQFSYASLNGLLVIAYQSGQARLHAWDGSTVRRLGLPTPSAPTVADSGAGSYAETTRFYRVRFTVQSGGVTIRRSEPSASVSFTPSGAGAVARITRPTAPNEGETHWELEASADGTNFFVIYGDVAGAALTAVVVATTTADDGILAGAYSQYGVSALTGTYTAPTSSKFVAADENRLLMFGDYTTTNKQNRVTFSAVVGSLNIGDVERIDTTAGYYIDLDEHDSGTPMGLIGPVGGSFFAFKDRQFWKLTPSGNPTAPYTRTKVSPVVGLVDPEAACVAEDEAGRPALYFMSHIGPYRWGANGLEYLGHGVEDLFLRDHPQSIAVINVEANRRVAVTEYVPEKRQVWFWWATGTSHDPDTKVVWNIGRVAGPEEDPYPSGWSRGTGPTANVRCGCLFADTIGASMSKDLRPYLGISSTVNTLYKADTTDADDNGTAFQAYVDDKVRAPWGLAYNGSVDRCLVTALAAGGVNVALTLTPDYGLNDAVVGAVSLDPEGNESRVQKVVADAVIGNVGVFQARFGDESAVANQWQLESAVIGWTQQDPR